MLSQNLNKESLWVIKIIVISGNDVLILFKILFSNCTSSALVDSRIIWESRGGKKTILTEEKPVIDFAYASVVTISDIKKGEIFSSQNIWVKRPGNGPLLAKDFESILGKTAENDIKKNSQLQPSDIKA